MNSLLNEMLQEVIGNDTRRAIRQVSKTTHVPFRWICSLKVFARHPDDPKRIVSMPGGTGLLISPCHVLTVGHNIHLDLNVRAAGGRIQTHRVLAHQIEVTPGRDGSKTPFGTYRSSVFQCHPNWVSNRDLRFDFGLITLPRSVGNTRFPAINNQPLGHWGSASFGFGTSLTPAAKADFKDKTVNIAGYPRDKGGLDQWLGFDRVTHADPVAAAAGNQPLPEVFLHAVDTCAGQSGAPVWLYNPETKNRRLVGIHRGGCEAAIQGCTNATGRPCFSTSTNRRASNLALWFSPNVLNMINQWIKQKPCK